MTLANVLDEAELLEQARSRANCRADCVARLIDFGVSPLRAQELAHGGVDLEPANPSATIDVDAHTSPGPRVIGGRGA